MTFTFLDDVALADMAFDAAGDTPVELFRAATEALIESLADPSTVAQACHETVALQDDDLSALLFDWLGHLVYLKDARGMVFHHVTLALGRSSDYGIWHLRAEVVGAPVDQSTQDLRSDVKGVTKHLYALRQEGDRWKARVVLDV
jgi:SHS2 domain-containing protein